MLKDIVRKSPYFIVKPAKDLYCRFPDCIRYGSLFRDKYEFLQESQWWSARQHEEYQMAKLIEVINYAYGNVPYYKRIFDDYGIKPYHIQCHNDIKKIPFLTREIIRKNSNELVSGRFNGVKLKYTATGGSTGEPLGFYQHKDVEDKLEWAYIINLWSRFGYDARKANRFVILRGTVPRKGNFEYRGNELILSSFALSEDDIAEYIKRMDDFQPDYIKAYPSSVILLAKQAYRSGKGVKLRNLKAVICTSENLYDEQRELIEKVFNTRVYSFYGHSEHCCLAGECEKSTHYHIQSEYGYTELLDENGKNVTGDGERGEIVCTGFNNLAFPFIRYRTGDIAVNRNGKCACGRNYRLIERVEGRAQEYVVTKKCSKVTFTGSYKIFDKIKDHIITGQFYQDKIGILELNLVKRDSYGEWCSDYIRSELYRKFKDSVTIKINFVDRIDRTKSGKCLFLVQKIPMDYTALII